MEHNVERKRHTMTADRVSDIQRSLCLMGYVHVGSDSIREMSDTHRYPYEPMTVSMRKAFDFVLQYVRKS